MARCGFTVAFFAALCLCGCADTLRSQGPAPKWTTGFWFWRGSSVDSTQPSEPLDVLCVQAGTISYQPYPVGREQWNAYGEWPDKLPAAREYWMVYRYDRQAVPNVHAAEVLTAQIMRLLKIARRRRMNVAGVQLDIDSPTGALPQYAAFLKEVRKGLPQGMRLSITALLDWFRGGTGIGEVIKEVDEFVPQFYDVGEESSFDRGGAIAANIDAAKWGPVFNRFGKPFRIGISTFGRARAVPHADPSQSRSRGIFFYADITPLDIAANPAFELQTKRSPAGEMVLNYRAARKARIGFNDFQAGDAIQFTLPSADAVRTATESARRMGGHLAGVLFFRWPAANETLALPPGEVLAAAGTAPSRPREPVGAVLVDGDCAAVHCVDVYLEHVRTLFPQAIRYLLRGSTELEYFLPEKNIPVKMSGASDLELSLPPFGGRSLMFLGRAVSLAPIEFKVEERQ